MNKQWLVLILMCVATGVQAMGEDGRGPRLPALYVRRNGQMVELNGEGFDAAVQPALRAAMEVGAEQERRRSGRYSMLYARQRVVQGQEGDIIEDRIVSVDCAPIQRDCLCAALFATVGWASHSMLSYFMNSDE